MKKSFLAIGMAAVMLLGATAVVPSRSAFAHTFSGDESASFLAKVQELKGETHLILQDVSNKTLAAWHLDKMSEFWNVNDTKEMAERNLRLSKEIPSALSNLTAAVNTTNPDAAKVKTIVDSLDGSLGEAVTARIDPTARGNSTVNVLALRAVLDETLEDYSIALGAAEESSSHSTESGGSSSNSTSASSTSNSTNGTTANVVNFAAYQTAQGLISAAQDSFNTIKSKAPANATAAIASVDEGLTKLKQAIANKMSNDQITAIISNTIDPNLQKAFNLKQETAPH